MTARSGRAARTRLRREHQVRDAKKLKEKKVENKIQVRVDAPKLCLDRERKQRERRGCWSQAPVFETLSVRRFADPFDDPPNALTEKSNAREARRALSFDRERGRVCPFIISRGRSMARPFGFDTNDRPREHCGETLYPLFSRRDCCKNHECEIFEAPELRAAA